MMVAVGKHLHTDARTRLLQAALELVAEQGYRGATTRAIAERAGVAEITLFRHFRTKADLVAEAVRWATEALGDLSQAPSDDLEHDLVTLARTYHRLIQSRRGVVLKLFPELGRHPELGRRFREVMGERMRGVFALFAYHQQAGRLKREPPASAALAFLGPLFAGSLLSELVRIETPFDAETYVLHYLEGRKLDD